MSDITQLLKKSGLKVTLPRVKILEILQNPQHQHIGAEDVYKVLLEQGEEIGLATVYRVLNQLDEAGLLARHHFSAGKAVFEFTNKHHHDHLVCLDCAEVIEFEDEEIEKRQMMIADRHGLELKDHSLYLYGTCKNKVNCKKYKKHNDEH